MTALVYPLLPAPDLVLGAATGFSFGDKYALGLVGFGVALFAAIGALSHEQERTFSASIVYLVLGVAAAAALAALGVSPIDPVHDAALVERVTELALIVAVFATGLSLERRLSWRGWRSVVILLAVVMPLTIAAVALFGALVMGLSVGAAIILGAALAPTDPVLAGDVGVGPPGDAVKRGGTRFSLSAEAALNDGLASPFVLLGILVAGEGGTRWIGEWAVADVAYATLVGGALGAVGGHLIAALAVRLRDAELLDNRLDAYFAIPTVLVVYGVAEVVGTYGLVAAFCAGVAFRRYEFEHEYNRHVHQGAELVEKFGELVVILLLGSMVTLSGLGEPGLSGWLLAPVLLLLIRPGLVLALFARSDMNLGERTFLGWFGVRGVAALYYVALVTGSGVLSPAEQTTVFWTVLVCVMLSILVHGLTATPLRRRLVE
ncbi:MAG: cation:proton antiporter [Actinomycetota bacterium]|nr:cation:proton antiporter [Actinomycetota bacterium]